MLEIIILGRGGQGAQTAGNQLAKALFSKGYYVQTFSTYGGARRGTPVTSSLRADTQPIRQRCNITSAIMDSAINTCTIIIMYNNTYLL